MAGNVSTLAVLDVIEKMGMKTHVDRAAMVKASVFAEGLIGGSDDCC